MRFAQTNTRDAHYDSPPERPTPPTQGFHKEHEERVMKKIAVVSIALAMLAASPALSRSRHHEQNQSWTAGQVDAGYYDPARVRSGDIPFAPF
jgi:hypothetical protein